jgi:hypothetical protein
VSLSSGDHLNNQCSAYLTGGWDLRTFQTRCPHDSGINLQLCFSFINLEDEQLRLMSCLCALPVQYMVLAQHCRSLREWKEH